MITHLPDNSYAGLVALRIGVLRLMAFAVFRPPGNGPTTFLLLLAATFPPPGIQVGWASRSTASAASSG